MEMRQHKLQTNPSIYKLAYDSNVTEADSRSPSPVEAESQVPSSLTNAEILIHEADSSSDAGSEDVELLPHRYESETFLNESKHVYVNKLSLAVELLRTQETLPYDDEFKRVVGGQNGKVNTGGWSRNPNNFENNNVTAVVKSNEVVTQCQSQNSLYANDGSDIFSEIEINSVEDESCEPAREAVARNDEIQDNTDETHGYRRFGIQARNYFSPRTALSLNPCFCCIIM